MASIFHARDLRTGEYVAIKIPHPETECDLVFFERFQREEEIGLRLDHPGILKVFPRHDHRRVYMVMEWVPGITLRKLLNQKAKLSIESIVAIVLAICDALAYIHRNGVVHRDLKPENIMVDAEHHIKIIDFGIAANRGSRRITFGKLSNTIGTPDYISPEQVQGKRGDERSDLYALGVTMYEMLTGQVPFRGTNPFAVMNQRLISDPVPPRQLNSAISPQLQEILFRSLERDPRDRYATADDFAWDFRNMGEIVVRMRHKVRRNFFGAPWTRTAVYYAALALIPSTIFSMMLFIARHG